MSELSPPTRSLTDKALEVAKALVGEVPLGGTLAALAGEFVRTPYERRSDEWQKRMGETLAELASSGVDIDRLQDDDKFVDCVFQATMAALNTGSQQKRQALQNAVANAAACQSVDASRQQVFLTLINDLTELHLALLAFAHDPPGWLKSQGKPLPELTMGSISHLITTGFPSLSNDSSYRDKLWRDLYDAGLIGIDSTLTMMSHSGIYASRTTPFGKQFLDFIESPPSVPSSST